MKKHLNFIGLALIVALLHLASCQKKVCTEDLGELPEYSIPEVKDTLIQQRRIYFAGERKLFESLESGRLKKVRKVVYRNVAQLPFSESGVIKLYLEVNQAGLVTYVETLPETTITNSNSLKKAVKAVFGYKYEPDYKTPVEAVVLTVKFDLTGLY